MSPECLSAPWFHTLPGVPLGLSSCWVAGGMIGSSAIAGWVGSKGPEVHQVRSHVQRHNSLECIMHSYSRPDAVCRSVLYTIVQYAVFSAGTTACVARSQRPLATPVALAGYCA